MGEEDHGRPGALKDVPWSVLVALVLNLVAGVWFASGLEQRVLRVENRQIEFASDVGRLDQARESTNLHMTQLDDQFKEIDKKLNAILSIMQDQGPQADDAPAGNGGVETKSVPPQNFTKPVRR